MDSQAQRHWLILNDAEFKLFQSASCSSTSSCQGAIRWSYPQLEDSRVTSGCNLSHDLPHRGSLCSSWITSSIIRPVNSLHDCVRCHASRSPSALRGRGSLWDQVTQPQESCTWSSQVVILHGSTSALQSFHTVVGQLRRPFTVHVISCSLLWVSQHQWSLCQLITQLYHQS